MSEMTEFDIVTTRMGVMEDTLKNIHAIKERLEEQTKKDAITIDLLNKKCNELRARIQKIETR